MTGQAHGRHIGRLFSDDDAYACDSCNLTALGTWNDVMTPLVIMSGTGHNTLPLAQLNFQTQFGTNYNLDIASYILALIPILVFYVICQKQI